jgi:hypothetical protein
MGEGLYVYAGNQARLKTCYRPGVRFAAWHLRKKWTISTLSCVTPVSRVR